jgi:hypothetical protein
VDEDDLIAFAVAIEVVHRLSGATHRYLDVVVPHQYLSPRHGVTLRRHVRSEEVAVRMAVGHPLVSSHRLELADLSDPAGRREVIEDGFVAREPLQAEDLLGQEDPVLAKLGVSLRRHLASSLVDRHLLSLLRERKVERAPHDRAGVHNHRPRRDHHA